MRSILTMLGILSVLFALSYCTSKNEPDSTKDQSANEKTELTDQELIAEGEYLVTIMGCNDCHTPKNFGPNGPELNKDLLLSGYSGEKEVMKADKGALRNNWMLISPDMTHTVGPWGASFSANLTPDPTGIGSWTEEQFKTALKHGKFKGMENGRTLLPPMPWQNFTNLRDEDAKAIFAYLKSIKPVNNVVPAPIPPDDL